MLLNCGPQRLGSELKTLVRYLSSTVHNSYRNRSQLLHKSTSSLHPFYNDAQGDSSRQPCGRPPSPSSLARNISCGGGHRGCHGRCHPEAGCTRSRGYRTRCGRNRGSPLCLCLADGRAVLTPGTLRERPRNSLLSGREAGSSSLGRVQEVYGE